MGKIWGIPIEINYSWIIVFLLFTYLLFGQFGHDYPRWPLFQRWSLAAVTTVLVFLSVLAHELSHSVVALHKGIPVRGITLFIFGGVSQLGHEARRASTEFLVAVVGPVSSVFLGLACGGLWYLSHEANDSLSAVFQTLFVVNLGLVFLNLLPGFPLDGGRVFRAAVWGITGNYWRATRVATRAGQVIGALMMVGGVSLAIFVSIESVWLALIGGFLFAAATASYRQERAREQFRTYRVENLMTTDWGLVPGETLLGSPLIAKGLSGHTDFLVVPVGGQVRGILTRYQLDQAASSVGPDTPVAAVMLPLEALPSLSPDDEIFSALERMDSENREWMVVLRNGVLLGFISREAAFRVVRLRPYSKP